MSLLKGKQLTSPVYLTGSLFGTASYAITASYALNGGGGPGSNPGGLNTQIQYNNNNTFEGVPVLTYSSSILRGSGSFSGSFTGDFYGTASYSNDTDLFDGKDSSTFATTGSNIFIGNQTVTGSLFTTGSTTQIGNNNLFGNTTLSGSIIISGSTTTPTVQVYGNVTHNGYVRFDPVNTNIDTSISASYIYVSGSTNDLYFSQNGSGFGNTTRLRWLEGNLYTGLLHGGLITTQSSTIFNVSSGSGIIVNLNASYVDNPYPTIQYLNWGNLSASITLTGSFDQSFVSINSDGQIYVQGTPYDDGQYNTLIPIGNVIHQNRSTINATATYPSVAYGWKQRSSDFIRAFGPLKLSGLNVAVSGSSTGSLIVTSGTAFSDGRNYTVNANNPSYINDTGTTISKIFRYYQSGSNGWKYDTNGGAGFATIDPTRYSNNGTLTTLTGSGANREWTIQRVYWFPGGATKGIYVYYGNAYYASKADAISNIDVESFVESPNTAAGAVLSGYLIVRNNADFTDSTSYQIIPSGLFRSVGGSGGGGSVVTQTLTGLSDVNISGPTNGQPLAYNSSTLKWENSSVITASLLGNASTATTASYSLSSSYAIDSLNSVSSSFAATASHAPLYVLTSATSSMLQPYVLTATTSSMRVLSSSYALTASYVLNAVSSSFASTALSAPLYVLTSATSSMLAPYVLTASTSSMRVLSSSFASTASYVNTLNQNVTITGTLIVSGSVGSTILNSNVDTLILTGSMIVTGSTLLIGNSIITGTVNVSSGVTGSLFGTASWSTNAVTASYILNAVSSSFAATASFAPLYVLTSSTSSMLTPYVLTSSTSSMTVALANTASYVTSSNVYGPFGANSVVSASFALSASWAPGGTGAGFPYTGYAQITGDLSVTGSAVISQGLSIDATFTSASSITTGLGPTTIITGPSGYQSLFSKYFVRNGANLRAGEFMMVWSGTTVSYTDTSTSDIGDTTAVVFTGSVSSGIPSITTEPGSGWLIKTLTTYL